MAEWTHAPVPIPSILLHLMIVYLQVRIIKAKTEVLIVPKVPASVKTKYALTGDTGTKKKTPKKEGASGISGGFSIEDNAIASDECRPTKPLD